MRRGGNGVGMRTSAKGIAFLERHEDVVLQAYRCPAGRWTIGAGLTAASGVVTPAAGMRITAGAASRLLAKALERNYEPSVQRAMPGASQEAFDAGVSFHFNTGAIGRAGWVKVWRGSRVAGWAAQVRARLGEWRRGGGRVLPGLVRRRKEEADLLLENSYGGAATQPRVAPREVAAPGAARLTRVAQDAGVGTIRAALRKLGYDPGPRADAVAERAVRDFQRAHGLTVDGVVGRATLTALERRLDRKSVV